MCFRVFVRLAGIRRDALVHVTQLKVAVYVYMCIHVHVYALGYLFVSPASAETLLSIFTTQFRGAVCMCIRVHVYTCTLRGLLLVLLVSAGTLLFWIWAFYMYENRSFLRK